jgi:hypothetical protein
VTARAGARSWLAFSGLPLLVLTNLYLRRSLEHAGLYLYDFLAVWYPDGVRVVFSGHYPWWKFFLPIQEFQGSWTTTTLIVTHVVTGWVGGAARVWYLYHAILIVVSFATSWAIFRSKTFSYTFAFCMGFGTQLYHTYSVPGSIALVLLPVYFELLLLCAYAIIRNDSPRSLIWAAFGAVTLVTALSYESWLDLMVFVWAMTPILVVALWRSGRTLEERRLVAVAGVLTIVACAYVYIKTHTGFAQVNGAESDVVFNYPAFAPKVEDVVSNALTHLYIVLTNFLPPVFLSSSALYELGGTQLVAYQYGYHAPSAYLVPMHYLFLWRYAAGAAAVVFGYALFRAIRSLWRAVTPDTIAVTVFLVLIAVGGPTHMFVKIRPMKTVPLLAYHAPVGILGMSLLISYLLMRARRDVTSPAVSAAVVAGAWCVMGYATLARPAMLDHLAAQAGLLEGQYPDPLGAIEQKVGLTIATPAGAPAYRLQPDDSTTTSIGLVREGGAWLPELPQRLPAAATWAPSAGVRVAALTDGVNVQGDDSKFDAQLSSPAVPLPSGSDVTLRMRVQVARGRLCTGVHGADGRQWILKPDAFKQEYRFNTGANDRVSVVIANCSRRVTETERSVFTFVGGSYLVTSTDHGADQEPRE